MLIFYYFLKRSLDDVENVFPFRTTDFWGEVGDFVEIDGVGYIITDYAFTFKDEDDPYGVEIPM